MLAKKSSTRIETFSENDLLGKSLLDICARGMAIYTELLRLADFLPPELFFATVAKTNAATLQSSSSHHAESGGGNYQQQQQQQQPQQAQQQPVHPQKSRNVKSDTTVVPLFTLAEYFADPERRETEINRNPILFQADEEFMKRHEEFLNRFYCACLGILHLNRELNRLMKDLRRGFYVSHTLEALLSSNVDGKQLIPEALHALGSCLLLLDKVYPTLPRERLLVAVYRSKGGSYSSLPYFDEVKRLLRGNTTTIELFVRAGVDTRVARAVVARLPADDVYNHYHAWPAAEHRSVALGNQAALIAIALFFCECEGREPESDGTTGSHASSGDAGGGGGDHSSINGGGGDGDSDPGSTPPLLSSRAATRVPPTALTGGFLSTRKQEMREVVDKHFYDMWVVPVAPGLCLDLQREWESFPCARAALLENGGVGRAAALLRANRTEAGECQAALDAYLARGVLTERLIIDRWDVLLQWLRKCNAVLRWRALHLRARPPAPLAAVAVPPEDAVRLLMSTAQLEESLREGVGRILAGKEEAWASYRAKASGRMRELSHYFGGDIPLVNVRRDDELVAWFASLAEEIEGLDYRGAPTAAGRRAQAIAAALEEAERLEETDSAQVREYLKDSRVLLERMVKTIGVRDELLSVVDIVSDAAYAFGTIAEEEYDPFWHARLKNDPGAVPQLRAVFVKFSSVLDAALARAAQHSLHGGGDVDAIAHYWSSRLVAFARRVLSVIPYSVFKLLDEDTEVIAAGRGARRGGDRANRGSGRSRGGASSPPFLLLEPMGAEELHYAAGREERFERARDRAGIAQLAHGVFAMVPMKFGIAEVNPGDILRAGLRNEMRRRIRSKTVALMESGGGGAKSYMRALWTAAEEIRALRECFLGAQDYLGMDGMRAWGEETAGALARMGRNEIRRLAKVVMLGAIDYNRGGGDETREEVREAVEALHVLLLDAGLAAIHHELGEEARVAGGEFLDPARNAGRWRILCGPYSLTQDRKRRVRGGTPAFVDDVRTARKAYGGDNFDHDFALLRKLGAIVELQRELKARAGRDAFPGPRVPFTHGATRRPLSASQSGDAIPLVVAERLFLVLNEAAKRSVNEALAEGGGNPDARRRALSRSCVVQYDLVVAGIARLLTIHPKHVAVESALGELLEWDCRALSRRALEESRTADSSLIFGFGPKKVALIAHKRLLQESTLVMMLDFALREEDERRVATFASRLNEYGMEAAALVGT